MMVDASVFIWDALIGLFLLNRATKNEIVQK